MANSEDKLAQEFASATIDDDKKTENKVSDVVGNNLGDDSENLALNVDENESSCEEDVEKDEVEEEQLTEEEKQRRKEEAFSYKNEGNEFFKEEKYREALRAYKRALKVCPAIYKNDRAILHSNRAACFQHLEQNDDAINECTKALELNEMYIKARLRRANIYEATDHLDEALEDFKKILESEPLHRDALNKSRELPLRIHERNEKLKTEMLGKLKDLGNMVLKPFGLSTDNFKVQQDPNSGGYSINFQQK